MGEATRRRNAGMGAFVGIGAALGAMSVGVSFVPRPHKADKGKKGGSCNREACQMPGAVWFNSGTRAFYCARCAHLINRAGYDNDRAYGRELTPICVRED